MRWLALVVLCACSFERQDGTGAVVDGALADAPPIDMPVQAGCPPSYAMKHEAHSYKLTDRDYTWTDAQAYCAQDGGHLVKIETQGEDEFIADAIDANEHRFVWIGLHDPQQTNALEWTDGSALGSFHHFGLGEPDGAPDKDCVDKNTTDIDGRWTTFRCDFEERGMCECDG